MKAPTVEEVVGVLVSAEWALSVVRDYAPNVAPLEERVRDMRARVATYGIAQPIKVEGTIGGGK